VSSWRSGAERPTGEVERIAGNVRGVAVHMAARVLALAGSGEVVVSATTHALTDGSGLEFEDAGRHVLKGLTGERQVYRLVARAGA
jgi:class 3 adenylate cyclase